MLSTLKPFKILPKRNGYSHSHIKRNQPQRISLQYTCSLTMINIVQKYLKYLKIHELNTLIRSSDYS